MADDFILKYDGTNEQLVGEDSNGNQIPIPLNALDVSGSASIDGTVEPFEAGHDDVRVPQVRELTVEDWESGTLDTDVWTVLGPSFSVQSSIVDSGQYALKSEKTNSGAASIASSSGLKSYPQSGDTFSVAFYLTDVDDKFRLGFGKQSDGEFDDGYNIQVRESVLKFTERPSINDSVTATLNLNSYLNEWLTLIVEWGADNQITVSITDESGDEINSVSHTISSDFYDSGSVGIYPRNQNRAFTQYFGSWTVTRREPEARANTQKGVTELGNEVVPSGSMHTGPQTASTNATRAVYQNAPVNNQATQGTQSKLTMLQSGVTPAMYMERTMDGQGGAYGHQLQAPLGRFSRKSAQLGWDYGSLSDVPNYNTGQSGSSHSFSLVNDPREVQIDTSTSSDSEFGGINSTVPVTTSLGAFRLTFEDVFFSQNDDKNRFLVGLTDTDPSSIESSSDGNGIYVDIRGNGGIVANVLDSGNKTTGGLPNLSFTTPHDLSIEYDGTEARFYLDGGGKVILSYSVDADFRPFIRTEQDASASTGETGRVLRANIEPLSEVLH